MTNHYSEEQFDLFETTERQKFDQYVHTRSGGYFMNEFIRLAWGLRKSGFKKFGQWDLAKYVLARMRMRAGPAAKIPGFGHSMLPYIVRYAIDKEPRLKGFFVLKELNEKKTKKVAIVNIKPKKEG